MLDYCVQDTAVTVSVFKKLNEEKGDHSWERPYLMEVKLADLTLRQELFGFELDKELATKNLEELEKFMTDIAAKIDPILPPKRLTKTQADYYTPPKLKFKKDGSLSSHMQKFLDKVGAELAEDKEYIIYEGKSIPVASDAAIKTETNATVEDIDTVKAYLLDLGWIPSEIKERDLVKNADKTSKTKPQVIETIDRYVEQTLNSVFRELRLDFLEMTANTLRDTLVDRIEYNKEGKIKPIFVPTTPKLTVGVEKEICPNLIRLGEKAAFVKDVVQYYTYRHRKNSIAGGDIDEDGEPETGFLSAVREDGRVPTPADTLGANTGRYRHKIVCNIPRVTSLYGEPMRNMFKSGKGLWQLGYDFASLEARIMGHYVLPYKDGKALAESLVAEKPNDVHSVNAKKLGIDRSSAKSFSYAAIYGAQPKKLSKMLGVTEARGKQLFKEYWEAVPALKELKERIEAVWEKTGKKSVPGLDGRLLNSRSKHSLINILFQSGGAITAKWSAVRMAQQLEKSNLLGDPFLHTTEEPKVWWMIHMHDEQQLAVHPKLMNVKGFSTEEEAKAVLQSGCSAIGHGSKGPYVGFKTIPVECIDFGIKTACKELGLRVDLGFEWIPGLSWGQCH
jgi:hypothetical protein